MFRKTYNSLMTKCIPEIRILRENISWDELANYSIECEISQKSTIFPPYHLEKVTVGDNSYLSRNSFASKVRIGKFCSIGPNLFAGWGIHPIHGISTSPSFYSIKKLKGVSLSRENKIEELKEINIGNDVFIGMNVTILDGVSINDGAVIGAGAVVSKDIPPYAVAVGCPIKIIRYRFSENQISALLRIKWWDFTDEALKDVETMFFNLDEFIKKYDIH